MRKEVPQATSRWQQGEASALREGQRQGPSPTQGVYRGQWGQNQPGGPPQLRPCRPTPQAWSECCTQQGSHHTPSNDLPHPGRHQQGWVPPVRVCVVQWLQPPKATTEDVTPATLTVTRTGPRGRTPPQCPSGSTDGKSTPDPQPAQHPGGPGSTPRTHRGPGKRQQSPGREGA